MKAFRKILPRGRTSPTGPTLILVCLLAMGAYSHAKEITSNGLGGGRWSDTATWRGGAVPTAEDDAVIAARDTVLFDRDDVDTPTCKQLILDPNSNLAFQSGLGKRTLTVNGPIEAYGSIKMHAAAMADEMEIRLASTVETERVIKLARGGALLVLGRPDLPGGRRNATISVSAPPVGKVVSTGQLTAATRTVIDLQNAHIDNLVVSVTSIDNTGAKPNERCSFAGNRFTGLSTLSVTSCDTPAVVKNEFEAPKLILIRPAALTVNSCPLAEIRGNKITGNYVAGIAVTLSEGSVTDNTVADCGQGIVWHTGPAMLKQNTIRNCKTGLILRTITGSAEDTFIDGGDLPVLVESTKAQLTSVVISNPPKTELMQMTRSSVGLLNCNIRPEQIKSVRDDTLPRNVSESDPPVEVMEFLVVGLKGTVPPRTQVEVVTSSPAAPRAPGAADLNIRNSPALVRPNGSTALPQSLTPLIVKSWMMGEDAKVVPAPEYTLNVLEPSAEPGAKPRVLKSLKIKPDETWFRPEPNAPKPTLEVELP